MSGAPDREELEEQVACFECGAPIETPAAHGLAVTEGIVLCEACCENRRAAARAGQPPLTPWFDDLTGVRRHT